MKNKKMLFGIILLLFAITGICSIPNVSAGDVVDLPPLSYVSYSNTFNSKDKFWITVDVLSDGAVNVYVMNEEQHDTLVDSGGLIWNYCKRWRDIIYLHDSFEVIEEGMYYVVVYNKDPLFHRTIDIDLRIYRYSPTVKTGPAFGWLIYIILPAIAGVVITIVLVRRHKRKVPEEDIKPEKIEVREKQILKIRYCPVCGAEILDKSRKFCSVCGTKIIN